MIVMEKRERKNKFRLGWSTVETKRKEIIQLRGQQHFDKIIIIIIIITYFRASIVSPSTTIMKDKDSQ